MAACHGKSPFLTSVPLIIVDSGGFLLPHTTSNVFSIRSNRTFTNWMVPTWNARRDIFNPNTVDADSRVLLVLVWYFVRVVATEFGGGTVKSVGTVHWSPIQIAFGENEWWAYRRTCFWREGKCSFRARNGQEMWYLNTFQELESRMFWHIQWYFHQTVCIHRCNV